MRVSAAQTNAAHPKNVGAFYSLRSLVFSIPVEFDPECLGMFARPLGNRLDHQGIGFLFPVQFGIAA
jgi:hypothetical protein